MKRIKSYLEKRALFPAWIARKPSSELLAIVVIPAYMEEELIHSLESLNACVSFPGKVEVLVVLNNSENSTAEVKNFHANQLQTLGAWKAGLSPNPNLQFEFIYADNLPDKKAGVGLARKIGLDEGARRFAELESNGLLICFDGDSTVRPNYLCEIIIFFQQNKKCNAASIHYEHPLDGLEEKTKQAIMLYELHLRTYLEAKRWMGHEYAFETIGSAMVVRAEAYANQGGMNVRKAGEDFYFLNKFTPLDYFGEIKNTCVYPSSRISKRVPFGTGRAMQDMLEEGKSWMTYSPKAYQILKDFFDAIDSFYSLEKTRWAALDEKLLRYLDRINFDKSLKEIKKNTKDFPSFRKRFLRFFDAFQIMKCLHFLEAQGLEKVPVKDAAQWLWKIKFKEDLNEIKLEELLLKYRAIAQVTLM